MKKNTYPVAVNAQAQKFREIFDTGLVEGRVSSSPGRVYGINNSPNLKMLFPQSPLYDDGKHTKANSANTDRGKFFENINSELTSHLTNEIISDMFAYVVDGSQNKTQAGVRQPHIQYEGQSEDNNYNWLYRDQPMDMNFNYLKPTSPNSKEFIKSSPDSNTAPVGSNAPIDNPELKDQPFWGHANLQVPSIDPFAQRQVETTPLGTKLPQLIRGSGGFGTNYPISNRPFASQEKIGQYFSNTYANDEPAGIEPNEVDRMGYIAGKSIISSGDNQPTGGNSAYKGDISPLGDVIDQAVEAVASQSKINLTPTLPRLI